MLHSSPVKTAMGGAPETAQVCQDINWLLKFCIFSKVHLFQPRRTMCLKTDGAAQSSASVCHWSGKSRWLTWRVCWQSRQQHAAWHCTRRRSDHGTPCVAYPSVLLHCPATTSNKCTGTHTWAPECITVGSMNPGSRHPPQKSPMHKDEIFCKRCVYSGSASLQHNSIIHCLAILVDGGASKAPILFLNWAQKQNVATSWLPQLARLIQFGCLL